MTQILPRFTQPALEHDPLEILLSRYEAKRQAAIDAINAGTAGDPAQLRGIPCIAEGVGGTSPGTNPPSAVIQKEHRLARRRQV